MKFTKKSKGFGGRGDLFPCCYDFEWSEITARGDRRPNLLLLWFQVNSNNSKRKWNVVGQLYLPSLGLLWYEEYYLNIFLTPKRGDIIFHKHFIFLYIFFYEYHLNWVKKLLCERLVTLIRFFPLFVYCKIIIII